MLVTWSKGHVDLSLGASYTKSAPCIVSSPYIFCKLRSSAIEDMHFICHVTSTEHSIAVPCRILGGSPSWYVTTLAIGIVRVTIGILIVKTKNVLCIVLRCGFMYSFKFLKNLRHIILGADYMEKN